MIKSRASSANGFLQGLTPSSIIDIKGSVLYLFNLGDVGVADLLLNPYALLLLLALLQLLLHLYLERFNQFLPPLLLHVVFELVPLLPINI